MGFFLLNESINTTWFIGAGLIMTGVSILVKSNTKKIKEE